MDPSRREGARVAPQKGWLPSQEGEAALSGWSSLGQEQSALAWWAAERAGSMRSGLPSCSRAGWAAPHSVRSVSHGPHTAFSMGLPLPCSSGRALPLLLTNRLPAPHLLGFPSSLLTGPRWWLGCSFVAVAGATIRVRRRVRYGDLPTWRPVHTVSVSIVVPPEVEFVVLPAA